MLMVGDILYSCDRQQVQHLLSDKSSMLSCRGVIGSEDKWKRAREVLRVAISQPSPDICRWVELCMPYSSLLQEAASNKLLRLAKGHLQLSRLRRRQH